MALKLERGDLLQLEPISFTGTLKLFPLGKKNKVKFFIEYPYPSIPVCHCNHLLILQQKLVIGDDSGRISCYEFKKGEPQVVFQTKAHEGPITCVALGGPASKRDKVILTNHKNNKFYISYPTKPKFIDIFLTWTNDSRHQQESNTIF